MNPIKFGTDGWRAIIADEFTVHNVARVAEGTAIWLKKQKEKPEIVLGHDCRFGGRLFCETIARVMGKLGVVTHLAPDFVSTPMVSLGAVSLGKDLGIIITASHNPPSYNGFKLKGPYGGPLIPAHVAEIEALIPDTPSVDYASVDLASLEQSGMLHVVDLETMYCDQVRKSFDLDAIRNSGLRLGYDAMYGAGQNVMRRLLPELTFLHCDYNPSFKGQAPEPIHKNLGEFSELIRSSGTIDSGLVTDGDADRLGFYDNQGRFIDSHHIILLLIHYLFAYKGWRGKVCTAFSTTPRVETLCRHYGIEIQTVKIGFKYIAEIMLKEDILLGGEESGGIAIKGHIPERDGIWNGLTLWEFMAKSGKTLNDLIAEVYAITGEFAFERNDLHIAEAVKQRALERCKAGSFTSFGPYQVQRTEDLDGFKYFFENGQWLMIRASGTEPVLRTYAESSTREGAFSILEAARKTLLD